MCIRSKRTFEFMFLIAGYVLFIFLFSYFADAATKSPVQDSEMVDYLSCFELLKALASSYITLILSINILLFVFIYHGTLRIVKRFWGLFDAQE